MLDSTIDVQLLVSVLKLCMLLQHQRKGEMTVEITTVSFSEFFKVTMYSYLLFKMCVRLMLTTKLFACFCQY